VNRAHGFPGCARSAGWLLIVATAPVAQPGALALPGHCVFRDNQDCGRNHEQQPEHVGWRAEQFRPVGLEHGVQGADHEREQQQESRGHADARRAEHRPCALAVGIDVILHDDAAPAVGAVAEGVDQFAVARLRRGMALFEQLQQPCREDQCRRWSDHLHHLFQLERHFVTFAGRLACA